MLRVPFLADLARVTGPQFVIGRYELARGHADRFARYGSLYREQTARAVRQGQDLDDGDYARALAERLAFREELTDRMDADGVDLWLTPRRPARPRSASPPPATP
ncbi:hypothetical protein NKH77_45175 [Streptomyces sp. M19]